MIECPLCDYSDTTQIFSRGRIPLYNLERHVTRKRALAAQTGPVAFHWCSACGFMFNASFDAQVMDYRVDYESSRSASETYVAYLRNVCEYIDARFPLREKTVVEVGCGDGQFLGMLQKRFGGTAIGFEPNATEVTIADVRVVNDYYDADRSGVSADLMVLRHVLEHQGDPASFIESILGTGSLMPRAVYIEVPAVEWLVAHDQVYAFSYEHCSYFSAPALQRLLESKGYQATPSFTFADEYLQTVGVRAMSRVDGSDSAAIGQRTAAVLAFKARLPAVIERLAGYFAGDCSDTVLWGAAGKGTMLLNILGLDYQAMPWVVDSNPRRWETFVPVTGQRVMSPEALSEIKPRRVLLTNPLYRHEIQVQLSTMGMSPSVEIIE